MDRKLVIIGAGSAMFTQGLVLDLIRKKPGGRRWHLALCDIDAEALSGVVELVGKMLRETQADVTLSWSQDRRAVLEGADYVVTTIGVGGRRAWEQDVLIPRKYGVFQPVGDTAMPGGISRAMRMVPAMLDIARDVRELAPQARFFNYANPMAIICRALYKRDIPVTGLCIGTIDSQWYIADTMGWPRDRFTALAAGINHCTFLYDFRLDGQDVKEEIREKALALADKPDGREPFAWRFFLTHGAFPAPGDRHITEFFTELFPGGAYYGKTLGVNAFSFEGTIAWGDKIHDDTMHLARADGPLGADFFTQLHGEHEQLMDIIDSTERDARGIYYMNTPNRGAVPNLPDGAVLEIPCAASAAGALPLQLQGFPDVLAAYTARFLSVIELAADAALNGDRKLMEEAILAGGYIADRNAVTAMVDELLAAHRGHLPQFK